MGSASAWMGSRRINRIRQVRLEDLSGPCARSPGSRQHSEKAAGRVNSDYRSRRLNRLRIVPGRCPAVWPSENSCCLNDRKMICSGFAVSFAANSPGSNYIPVVGDILDVGLLREVFAAHRPHSVFHAAAYKHVPMMETNCFQAVTNNIFGTYNVALVARQFEVGDFVMISTDKAVKPTNIMGVSKRVAELIILGLQHQRTRYVAVRFGNVLGSNGSVLPTFEEADSEWRASHRHPSGSQTILHAYS